MATCAVANLTTIILQCSPSRLLPWHHNSSKLPGSLLFRSNIRFDSTSGTALVAMGISVFKIHLESASSPGKKQIICNHKPEKVGH